MCGGPHIITFARKVRSELICVFTNYGGDRSGIGQQEGGILVKRCSRQGGWVDGWVQRRELKQEKDVCKGLSPP